MVAEIKLEDGYVVEYDEYGNRMRSYGSGNITRIAFNGSWVATYIEPQNTICTYCDGIYSGGFNLPSGIGNIQMSGDTVIVQFSNGQTYEYSHGGAFLRGY